MKGQGRIFLPKVRGKRTRVYWMDYCVNGVRHRESTQSRVRADALELLRQRIGDRKAGKMIESPGKVTLGDLRTLVERQYVLDGLRSKKRVLECWKHLLEFFHPEAIANSIATDRLDDYATTRLKVVKRQTINNELATLRHGFKLAIEKGKLAVMPTFRLPKVHNVRTGYFETQDFAALQAELPADVWQLVQFLRYTGWRSEEGRLLAWQFIDLEGETIRLEQVRSKSGEQRVFPFGLAPALKELLEARNAARNGPYVFQRAGEALTKAAVRYAWKRATRRAGLQGMLVHDLRRTAARDFRRAGVSEAEIMRLCGWKTRAMFDRYNIVDEEDLARSVSKRFSEMSELQSE